MKEWFDALDPRERVFVMAAAGVLVLAVFYLAVWMPVDRGQRNTANSVENWRESIAELRLLRGVVQRDGGDAARVEGLNKSLVVIVDETLRNRGLYGALQRSQPTGQNGIQVVFENASFDDLVFWLGDLGSNYGLQVQSASVSAATRQADGRVNATISLER